MTQTLEKHTLSAPRSEGVSPTSPRLKTDAGETHTPQFAKRHAPGAAIFAITLLLSSTLLFLIQPMFAKLVLPRLGGTAAVWNTCMVFFQAALLAGYGYAHFVARRLRPLAQVIVHAA